MSEQRLPLPPFTFETAIEKVRKAENAWNTRDPAQVALGYGADSIWRNRAEFLVDREAIVALLVSPIERPDCDLPPTMRCWRFDGHTAAPHHLSGPPPPATAGLEIGATVAVPIVRAATASTIASDVFMSALLYDRC